MIGLCVYMLTKCGGRKDMGSEERRTGNCGLGGKEGGMTLPATGGRWSPAEDRDRHRHMLSAQHGVPMSSIHPHRLSLLSPPCPSGCNQLPLQH